jgi:hypothetical protein
MGQKIGMKIAIDTKYDKEKSKYVKMWKQLMDECKEQAK